MRKLFLVPFAYLFLNVTCVLGQCGTNILTNPGFDTPIQPNNGDNILNSFSFNGWTMTGGQGFNIVKPNGFYPVGPDYAKDGTQFTEVAYGDGTVYQDFTISGANTNIAFGGFYSSRTGATWSASIGIYSMPGNILVSTTNIVLYTGQGIKVWLPVQGNATLNTGNYRFVANIPDDANFDAAFVFANCSFPTVPAQKPGSGTALTFNGTSDYVDLGTAFNDQNFTVEMWLKPGATQTGYNDIIDNNPNAVPGAGWVIQQNALTTNEYFGYVSGTITANFTLIPNVWQHLVLVKSPTAILIYVNGILINSTPWSGTVFYSSNFLRLGTFGGTSSGNLYHWNGSMDEVRIWNTPLSQTQIRDRMCHKITASDPLYSNLKAYYNFDEGLGYNLFDSKNSITGAIIGPSWATSGAPIGNFSSHNYSGGLSAASLTHPTRGDALTATLTSGNADGIHVYNVTEAPNTTNGILGIGSNNAYFGTFVVNGSNPAYDAVYNYANAFLNNNENDFRLFKRDDNAGTAWVDCNAVLNTIDNTLTITGQHTEYMVGSIGAILPITGLWFTATNDYNKVRLAWHTVTETNTSRFEIERSKNGIQFEKIADVWAAGNSSIRKDYSYTDAAPEKNLNYYRLKQVDIDGRYIYSAILPVKFGDDKKFSIYPNPIKKGESLLLSLQNITATKIEIINALGQVVYSSSVKQTGSFSLPVSSSLMPGQYVVRVVSESRVDVQKILIQ